ncbi:hypothetical protein O181_002732 [Austropuccinia psidii MF-1]|uniref:Uncharacterized protein n=1 Tax=Austropuccinia psidii MF-1 TaxID=1389203 RepID=A0A9Q3GE85_9BASI|nr:hypothetical protein [Austropuccinia psidii MF-1]
MILVSVSNHTTHLFDILSTVLTSIKSKIIISTLKSTPFVLLIIYDDDDHSRHMNFLYNVGNDVFKDHCHLLLKILYNLFQSLMPHLDEGTRGRIASFYPGVESSGVPECPTSSCNHPVWKLCTALETQHGIWSSAVYEPSSASTSVPAQENGPEKSASGFRKRFRDLEALENNSANKKTKTARLQNIIHIPTPKSWPQQMRVGTGNFPREYEFFQTHDSTLSQNTVNPVLALLNNPEFSTREPLYFGNLRPHQEFGKDLGNAFSPSSEALHRTPFGDCLNVGLSEKPTAVHPSGNVAQSQILNKNLQIKSVASSEELRSESNIPNLDLTISNYRTRGYQKKDVRHFQDRHDILGFPFDASELRKQIELNTLEENQEIFMASLSKLYALGDSSNTPQKIEKMKGLLKSLWRLDLRILGLLGPVYNKEILTREREALWRLDPTFQRLNLLLLEYFRFSNDEKKWVVKFGRRPTEVVWKSELEEAQIILIFIMDYYKTKSEQKWDFFFGNEDRFLGFLGRFIKSFEQYQVSQLSRNIEQRLGAMTAFPWEEPFKYPLHTTPVQFQSSFSPYLREWFKENGYGCLKNKLQRFSDEARTEREMSLLLPITYEPYIYKFLQEFNVRNNDKISTEVLELITRNVSKLSIQLAKYSKKSTEEAVATSQKASLKGEFPEKIQALFMRMFKFNQAFLFYFANQRNARLVETGQILLQHWLGQTLPNVLASKAVKSLVLKSVLKYLRPDLFNDEKLEAKENIEASQELLPDEGDNQATNLALIFLETYYKEANFHKWNILFGVRGGPSRFTQYLVFSILRYKWGNFNTQKKIAEVGVLPWEEKWRQEIAPKFWTNLVKFMSKVYLSLQSESDSPITRIKIQNKLF